MSRSQYGGPERQPTVFLNRDAQLALIGSHVDLLHRDSRHLAVFEVIGLGGVGKTRLLTEMQLRAQRAKRTSHVLSVPLEIEAAATVTGPLSVLREQTSIDCLLFDAALLTYLSATGQPFSTDSQSRMARSLAFKTLDIGRAVAHIPVPLTFAADVYHSVARSVIKSWHYDERDFQAIDRLRMDPSALLQRLPHWLAVDIRRRLEVTGDTLIVFYDAYDKQTSATRADGAPWLREFIGTLDRGVHVIGTRELVRWDEADWGAVLQTVKVDDLPDREAREMVRGRLGQVPVDIEERLLQASGRIPFFLEAAIDDYDLLSGEGEVRVGDLPASQDASLTHLLEHLPPEQQTLAIALATIQIFDFPMYLYVIRDLNIPVSGPDFDAFVTRFFVEEVADGIYKTHDLLTGFVREGTGHSLTRRLALGAAGAQLRARGGRGAEATPTAVLQMFRSVLAGWARVGDMPLLAVETLVDVGYRLHDAGYWQELAAMAPEETATGDDRATVVTAFFQALAARRAVGITRALELLENVEARAGALGRHRRSVDLEVAYLSEIAGNYATAREEFRKLDEEAVPFDPTDRTHMRARLYHADMMINDGDLLQASRTLLEAYELVGHDSPLDWAELVRHRGHALRFSFLFTQAELLYGQAMRVAADAPALLGKLHTNVAECACWHDPLGALEAAAASAEVNVRLGNKIELAKCEAARGIAFGQLGEWNAARDAVAQAASRAREVGYPAGLAFALQAEVVVERHAGDLERCSAAAAALDATLTQIGTYAHLRTIPAWLSDDETAFAAAVDDAAWVDPGGVAERLQACFATSSRRR